MGKCQRKSGIFWGQFPLVDLGALAANRYLNQSDNLFLPGVLGNQIPLFIVQSKTDFTTVVHPGVTFSLH